MNLISDSKWNHFNYTKIINFYSLKKKNIRILKKRYNNEPFYYNYKTEH